MRSDNPQVTITIAPIPEGQSRGEVIAQLKQQLLGRQLSYHADGKPYLLESPATLSISHSVHWLAVAIDPSSSPLGIDVEEKAEQALRTLHRYSSPHERELLEYYQMPPIQLWTAKEAVYKAHSHQLPRGINQVEMVEPTRFSFVDVEGVRHFQAVHSYFLSEQALHLTVATDHPALLFFRHPLSSTLY